MEAENSVVTAAGGEEGKVKVEEGFGGSIVMKK